jgi:nitrite reductase/ring-hydroxylating ferredoxin subunit
MPGLLGQATCTDGWEPSWVRGLPLYLREHWMPILRSADLPPGVPVPARRLGEDLVMWRDSAGDPVVMTDRCPHRGAKLSGSRLCPGEVVGDEIQCPYHGWRYDQQGQCTKVPQATDTSGDHLRRRARVLGVYPAADRVGLIWAFMRSRVEPPVLDPYIPWQMEDPAWDGGVVRAVVAGGNWRLWLENSVDPCHPRFLHRRSSNAARYVVTVAPEIQEIEITYEDLPDGMLVTAKEEIEGGETFTIPFRFSLPYRVEIARVEPYATPGPGGPRMAVQWMVPVDEASTYVVTATYRNVEGQDRAEWRARFRDQLFESVRRVVDEDEGVIVTQQEQTSSCWRYETLGALDKGVTRLRRLLQKALEQEARQSADATPAFASLPSY